MMGDSTVDVFNLSVVSYNMHGFFQGCSVVDDLIHDSHPPDVFLLQEHWLTPANLCYFSKFSSEYFYFGSSAMSKCVEEGMLRGRPYGGVVTLISNKLRHLTESVHCDDRYAIIKIADYLITNVYMPCVGTPERVDICDSVLDEIRVWRERYDDCHFVIGGDFNVDLDCLGDLVAKRLRRFADELSLNRGDNLVPNMKRPTYVNIPLKHESQIDYFLVSPSCNFINFCVIDPDINFSDHLPIVITVRCCARSNAATSATLKQARESKQRQLRWDLGNRAAYYSFTGDHLSPLLLSVDTLFSSLADSQPISDDFMICMDSIYNEIVFVLQAGAELYIPEFRKNFLKFWWDEELSLLKKSSIETNAVWKAAGKPKHGPIFDKRQSSRLLYRKRLREGQRIETESYSNALHEALLLKNGNKFWRCWRSKFESRNKCSEVDHCVDPYVITEKFASHFSQSFSCNNSNRMTELHDEYNRLRGDYYGLPLSDDINFDTELVSKVILNLERGKAADIVGLSAEHLLFCHPVLSMVLSKYFQLILLSSYVPAGFKCSYMVPIPKIKDCNTRSISYDDFRGIAISPILSKVFEYCFLDRFNSFLSSSCNQFGFKKGMGCSHAIYTAKNIVGKFVSNGSTVNLCAIDLSKAFDKVNHHGLFLKLMKRQIPTKLLTILENLFKDCFTCVKWENLYSDAFRLDFGVRQGSVLSPFLFAVYLDDLTNICLHHKGCFILLYADDILLISPSVCELELLLHACERELRWLDMTINFKKSCCLRIGPRNDVVCAKIASVSGCVLPWVPETRYLGVYIVNSKSFKCSIDAAKRAFYRSANAIFGKIGRIASEEVTLQLIQSKSVPLLLYGLEACPLNKSQLNSIDFVINRFFMKLFKTSDRNIVEICQEKFGFVLPSIQLDKRRKKFEENYMNTCDMYI